MKPFLNPELSQIVQIAAATASQAESSVIGHVSLCDQCWKDTLDAGAAAFWELCPIGQRLAHYRQSSQFTLRDLVLAARQLDVPPTMVTPGSTAN